MMLSVGSITCLIFNSQICFVFLSCWHCLCISHFDFVQIFSLIFIFCNNNNNYLKCWLTLQFAPHILRIGRFYQVQVQKISVNGIERLVSISRESVKKRGGDWTCSLAGIIFLWILHVLLILRLVRAQNVVIVFAKLLDVDTVHFTGSDISQSTWILQELIQQMANVQYTENVTEEQLDAMAGSETLRYQATSFGITRNNKVASVYNGCFNGKIVVLSYHGYCWLLFMIVSSKTAQFVCSKDIWCLQALVKSTNRLRDSLLPKEEPKLAVPLLLLIAQYRSMWDSFKWFVELIISFFSTSMFFKWQVSFAFLVSKVNHPAIAVLCTYRAASFLAFHIYFKERTFIVFI